MCNVITIGMVKGGCAKTTTTSITGYILSEMINEESKKEKKPRKNRVLCIDADGQGNLTECYTLKPIRDYRLEGIGGYLEAIQGAYAGKDPRQYIFELSETLHLLPASELIGTLPNWIFDKRKYQGNPVLAVKNMIDMLKNSYDYILFDTAPELGFNLANCFAASSGCIALFETGRFCFSSLLTFCETIETIKYPDENGNPAVNPELQLIGILPSMLDNRRNDNRDFLTLLRQHEEIGEYSFETVITRKAATGRLSYMGFYGNPELNQAIDQFRPYVEELLERIEVKS